MAFEKFKNFVSGLFSRKEKKEANGKEEGGTGKVSQTHLFHGKDDGNEDKLSENNKESSTQVNADKAEPLEPQRFPKETRNTPNTWKKPPLSQSTQSGHNRASLQSGTLGKGTTSLQSGTSGRGATSTQSRTQSQDTASRQSGTSGRGATFTQSGTSGRGATSTQSGTSGKGTTSTQSGTLGKGTTSPQLGALGRGATSTQFRTESQDTASLQSGTSGRGTTSLQSRTQSQDTASRQSGTSGRGTTSTQFRAQSQDTASRQSDTLGRGTTSTQFRTQSQDTASTRPRITTREMPSVSALPAGRWQAVGESVVGMAHRKMNPPVGCQDAHSFSVGDRPVIVVCDGAGSARSSEIGSQKLSRGMVRFCCSLEPIWSRLLDLNETGLEKELAMMIFQYARLLMQDIGTEEKRNIQDLRTTMLLALAGKKQLFWLRVGDGEIVIENHGKLELAGRAQKSGEFSNQTVFVGERFAFTDMHYGLIESQHITGISLMTDGADQKLVSVDGKQIAPRLSEYFELLRKERLPREKIYKFLTDPEVWQGTNHDDKTLVLCAR